MGVETRNKTQRETTMKTNELAIARKAIKNAIAKGDICREISGMHRVAFDAIRGMCKNDEIAMELAWEAAKDIKLG